uniref:Solute carrier family 10 member 6-like n=1 Tax=Saccoglossus kowalevskii TaxID=10224 RepID=A0ABM0MRW0_SACKO
MDTTTIETTTGNESSDGGGVPPLVIASQVDINVTLFIMMVSMGCTMTVGEIKQVFKQPRGIAIGIICQFGLMPLLGFSLAHAFSLEPNVAIGTIIIASCPGGVLSNAMTYWTQGDTVL